MINKDVGHPARAGALAQQIVELLSGEEPTTRSRALAAAATLLDVAPQSSGSQVLQTEHSGGRPGHDQAELAAFFNRAEELKPADNAQLCAAFHYSLYGPVAFTFAELRAIASEAGVVLPDRIDMSLGQSSRKGKRLFQSAGRGSMKPTATAALMFAERWNLKPGRRSKSPVSAPAGATHAQAR